MPLDHAVNPTFNSMLSMYNLQTTVEGNEKMGDETRSKAGGEKRVGRELVALPTETGVEGNRTPSSKTRNLKRGKLVHRYCNGWTI